ncbi:hypothetical protein CBF23_014485 [Marinomonas agarivorans]|nr:hypothetical protein CBF23_014485 [Marinomonas agarivorans]
MKRLYYCLLFGIAGSLSNGISANDNCQSCHTEASADWQQSHHAKSMAEANPDTVLGDFDNHQTTHFQQSVRFYTKDNQYKMDLHEAGVTTTYTVAYVFGFTPLQQYLIETESGQFQVFPFAWDTRPKKEGGQKWYANNLAEDIQPNDRLHWLQPLQNWNGMCADCHSDGLVRNYSLEKHTFSSHYTNINVGCVSCHADMTDDHSDNHTKAKSLDSKQAKPTDMSGWKRANNANIASWQGKPRDNSFMEQCYACHSLRSPLTDGFNPVQSYLDQFSPTFLEPNLYHADGQIKEEVYVFGSFKQSKMHQAGVNCLDCHDKHTMKVKTLENTLCLQCHNPQRYQQESHFKHDLGSEGAQCINCHMPENRYMGVDDRRDHSFKIPRPHVSVDYQTPNACVQCHQGKTNEWAAEITTKWYGPPAPYSTSEKALLELRSLRLLPFPQHLRLINDTTLSEIERASAIIYLGNTPYQLTDAIIRDWVTSPLPLIRLAIARMGFLLPVAERQKTYATLTEDRFKAIRVAAAQNLAYQANTTQSEALSAALLELEVANAINAWRGEGNINQSIVAIQKGDLAAAAEALTRSLKVDPYFADSYVNLADIYHQQGKQQQEKDALNQGLLAVPNSASLHYAKGLFFIRAGDKKASVAEFKTAMTLMPSNSQFAYLYFLALDSVGLTRQALTELRTVVKRYPNDGRMINLGLGFAQKLNDRQTFFYFQALAPR